MIDKYERFLEKKKLYIQNPTLYLLIFMIIGYSLRMIAPTIYTQLFFDPYYIFKGQIWRVISWIFLTTLDFSNITNILFSFISMFFYYFIGKNVENEFGTAKYNVFLQFSFFLTILGHFLLYGALYMLVGPVNTQLISLANSPYITNAYVLQSLFMVYAFLNPEERINIYFLIPVKVKYLAIVYLLLTGFNLITGNLGVKITIICAFLNLAVFFIDSRRPFKKVKQIKPKTFVHKCVVCGKTSEDGSLFRFCSKCTGQKEYCLEHIKNHTHS